jgi:hypothetical protein
MRTGSGALRTGVLALASIAGVILFTWWRLHFETGCPPFTRPGGPPSPPFDWYVARATLPPLAFLVVGAFVALGAPEVRWRILGLLIVLGASLAALFVGTLIVQVCM